MSDDRLTTMVDIQFLDLPRMSYIMMDGDWQRLQLHGIMVKDAEGSALRSSSAGEYDGRPQEIPERFAAIEKAILELKSRSVSKATPCTVAPSLWSSRTKIGIHTPVMGARSSSHPQSDY